VLNKKSQTSRDLTLVKKINSTKNHGNLMLEVIGSMAQFKVRSSSEERNSVRANTSEEISIYQDTDM